MKSGMTEGQMATIDITVTSEMYAQFDGTVVHPAYSTVTMIYHMEWVSRKIILPYLEEHEEGMGAAVSAKHLFPAREGTILIITAIVSKLTKNTVVTEVTVKSKEKLIGIGEVKQIILTKSKIASLLQQ